MVKRGGGVGPSSCMSNPKSPSCKEPPSNAEVVAESERIEKALSGIKIQELNELTVDAVEKIVLELELKYLGESTIDQKIQKHKDAIDTIIEKLPESVLIGKKKLFTVLKTRLKEEIDILAKAYKYRNEFMDMVNKLEDTKTPKITEQIKKSILTEMNKTYKIIDNVALNNKRRTKSELDSYLNTDDTVINVPNKYTEKEWRNAIIIIVKYCEAFRISHENDVRKLLKYIRDNFFPKVQELRVGGNNLKKLLKKVDLTQVPKIYLIKKNDYKKQNIRVLESPMYATIKLLKNKETQGIRVDDAFVKWLEKKSSSATTA